MKNPYENNQISPSNDNEKGIVSKSIETRRQEDIDSVKNYTGGGLKLNIYVPIADRTKDVLVGSDIGDGKFEVFPLNNSTGKPFGPFYDITKEQIIDGINAKYNLDIKKNEELKKHLIGSEFENSKKEKITIEAIDFDSDQLVIKHEGKESIRSYSEALKTSKPLQQHVASIEKLLK